MEIPVNELPIESVVIRDEETSTRGVDPQPVAETFHDRLGVVKLETLVPAEPAHRQGFGDEVARDGLELCIKGPIERRVDDDRSEANHRIVAGYRTVGFDIYHY